MSELQPNEAKSRFPDGFRILQGRQEYITYLEHSSIRIWASDVSSHYDNHSHSAVEIIMPHRGLVVYQLQDEVFRVQPGEVLILPSGCMHALTEPPDTQRYLLLFEPNPFTGLRDIPHGLWLRKLITGRDDWTLLAHRGSYKTTCLSLAMAALMCLSPGRSILFLRKTDKDVEEDLTSLAENH